MNNLGYAVKATLGMNLGTVMYFDQYEDASDLAHLLLQGQPSGLLEVISPSGIVIWSYEKAH